MNNSTLDRLKIFFQAKPVLRAYLFGSEARNEATDSSDIDIMVDLDYTTPIGLEFVSMQIELEKLFKKKVDLVSSKGISKYILPYINQDKILIYEKQTRGDRARLLHISDAINEIEKYIVNCV